MASSSSSSSLPLPPLKKYGGHRNWADLPPELTSSILLRLGAIEILENAQKVCKSWHHVCKDPSMWRKIKMDHEKWYESLNTMLRHETICRHAVDRSLGGLVEIDIWYIGTNSLLSYIVDSTSNLRRLRLPWCNVITDEGYLKAVVKLPLLEELDISYCSILEETLEVLGKSCPKLKTLHALNLCSPVIDYDAEAIEINGTDDEFAIAIAESMPELRHLQLAGNGLISNKGLEAILDACPHLEHLDLRECYNINLVGDLQKRCSEKIRVLRRPNDTTADYPLYVRFLDGY
ncbi:unnamed protein product [Microthlaspi erraticum]|uniref:F-box domain-containing protein n=1 Tax=Microthlaspi erraticum TaxID=1685480 RepID=A0A6D2KI83_9BRAS|nr:unnamed protein product [Microthlaspi erraticum]